MASGCHEGSEPIVLWVSEAAGDPAHRLDVKRPGFGSDPTEGESEHAQEVQSRAA